MAADVAALTGKLHPKELSGIHVTALVTGWKLKLSTNTIYTRVNRLKKLLALMGRADVRPPKTRSPRPRTTVATVDELDKLITAAKPWLRCIVLLGIHCGSRRSDCMKVKPANYNPETHTLQIRQQKTDEPVIIPTTQAVDKLFADLPADADPQQPLYRLYGGPCTREAVTGAWNRLKKETQVNPKLWIHDLRRTLAVSIYEISKDLRVAEQVLGHRSLAATVRYLEHRDPSTLRPYLQSLFTPKGPVQ